MRALLAPTLGLVLVLAGCLGTGAPSDLNVAPTDTAASPAGPNVTGAAAGAPNALRGGGNSSLMPLDGETLATAWVRNYWQDRMEVVLIEETGSVSNEGDTDVLNCLLNCNNAFFTPGNGTFVAPGAKTVEVTASWTPPPTAPSMAMGLAYRTAADADEVFQFVESGATLSIPVTDKDADAPFAPASQWWFSFFPQARPVGSVTPTEIAVKVVVKRAAGLPVFGEAKDPWGGKPSVALAHLQGDEQIWFTPMTFSCFNCQTGWDSRGPGLVGEGARRIEATATWSWPGPAKPVLHYWNSVAGNAGEVVPLATDGETSRVFVLESFPPEQTDSPYQQRSTWGFWVSFDGGPVPAGTAIGTLSIDVVAFR